MIAFISCNPSLPSDVDVKEGLIVVQTTIDLMNNNKFVEAIQLIKPK